MTIKDTTGNIIRFTNNTGGLEKILRGLIGILLLPQTPTARFISPLKPQNEHRLLKATKQVSVARKVVRVLYFFDSAWKAVEARGRNGGKAGFKKWLGYGKWACMSVFFIVEAFAMILRSSRSRADPSRGLSVYKNGYKFYALAVCFSIATDAREMWELHRESVQRRAERRKLRPQRARGRNASSSDYSSESEDESPSRRDVAGYDGRYGESSSSGPGGLPGAWRNVNDEFTATQSRGLSNYVAVAENTEMGHHMASAPLNPSTVAARLMADICDLIVQSSKAGFFKGPEAVSFAQIFYSLLAGSIIWERINPKPTRSRNGGTNGNGWNGNGGGMRGGMAQNAAQRHGQYYLPGAQQSPSPTTGYR